MAAVLVLMIAIHEVSFSLLMLVNPYDVYNDDLNERSAEVSSVSSNTQKCVDLAIASKTMMIQIFSLKIDE